MQDVCKTGEKEPILFIMAAKSGNEAQRQQKKDRELTLNAWAESSQAHTSHKRELPNMAGMRNAFDTSTQQGDK